LAGTLVWHHLFLPTTFRTRGNLKKKVNSVAIGHERKQGKAVFNLGASVPGVPAPLLIDKGKERGEVYNCCPRHAFFCRNIMYVNFANATDQGHKVREK